MSSFRSLGSSRALGISLLMLCMFYSSDVWAEAQTSAAQLEVLVHLEGIGDRRGPAGQWVGTRGENRRLEGFQVTANGTQGLGVQCMAHLQDQGDTPWSSGFTGTRGQSRRLEGFACRLTGSGAGVYDIRYRAHLENVGDTGVFANGTYCGTRGQFRRLEAIMVWVERRAQPRTEVALDLLVHIQGTGDRTFAAGQWTNTEGGHTLEGFHLRVHGAQGLTVECMAHLQDQGDTSWTSEFIGTRGQSSRLEGFACRLTGNNAGEYHLLYRGRVQGSGETSQVGDGTFCGTRGQSRALEAILIWITRQSSP